MMLKAQIKPQADGQFRVIFKSGNGEPWFQSTEGYTRRTDAQRAATDFAEAVWDSWRTPDFEIEHVDEDGNVV